MRVKKVGAGLPVKGRSVVKYLDPFVWVNLAYVKEEDGKCSRRRIVGTPHTAHEVEMGRMGVGRTLIRPIRASVLNASIYTSTRKNGMC